MDLYFQPNDEQAVEHGEVAEPPEWLPFYEDVHPVPMYSYHDEAAQPCYDDVPIHQDEILAVARLFEWAKIQLQEEHAAVTSQPEVFEEGMLEMVAGFFRNPRSEDTGHTQLEVVTAPTAFPALGQEHTCHCWMIQEASMLTPAEAVVVKVLFESYRSLGGGVLITNEGIEGRLLTTRGNRRYYLVPSIPPCGCTDYGLFSATTCHLSEGDYEVGHDVIHHATFHGSRNNLGKLEPMSVHVHKHVDALLREGLHDDGIPPCHHRAPVRVERYHGPTLVRNYVPLSKRLLQPVRQVEGRSQHDDLAEKFHYLIDIRIRTYENQFGARVIGDDWHDCTNKVQTEWFAPFSGSADHTPVRTNDIVLPKCVKRRYKTLSSLLARAASVYGGKILIDKSFEASSYQEWAEMNQRRYELANELSHTDRVRAMPQVARTWLKTADAKHRLNRIVRKHLTDPAGAQRLLSEFNSFFVRVMGGSPIEIPVHLLLSAQKALEREDELRRKQNIASTARKFVPGRGLQA